MVALLLFACSGEEATDVEITDAEVEESTDEVLEEDDAMESEEEPVEEEEEIVEDESSEEETETADEAEESTEEEEEVVDETEFTVQMTDDGFVPETLTLNVGDTITWVNEREDPPLHQAMVVGLRLHNDILSPVLLPGETYTWTFTETGEYDIVDGILSSASMEIIVE